MDLPLLERFRAAMDRAEAAAVLASTWRYDPAGLFSARHWGIPYVDVTPDMPDRRHRDEILSWLRDHAEVRRGT